MIHINDIIQFVSEKTGSDTVTEYSDIESDLSCTGADLLELIDAYSKKSCSTNSLLN